MCAAATAEAGLVLLPTDRGFGTYRDFQHQVDGFKFHYSTERHDGAPTKFWDGQTWYRKKGMVEAATPGQSNHGFGLAIDVGFLDADPTNALSTWVLDNYDRFGFSHEFHDKTDPRHIRYYAGDVIPDAVAGTEVHDVGRGDSHNLEDDMLPIVTNAEQMGRTPPLVTKFVIMDNGKLRALSEAEWMVRGALTGTPWTTDEILAAGFASD